MGGFDKIWKFQILLNPSLNETGSAEINSFRQNSNFNYLLLFDMLKCLKNALTDIVITVNLIGIQIFTPHYPPFSDIVVVFINNTYINISYKMCFNINQDLELFYLENSLSLVLEIVYLIGRIITEGFINFSNSLT